MKYFYILQLVSLSLLNDHVSSFQAIERNNGRSFSLPKMMQKDDTYMTKDCNERRSFLLKTSSLIGTSFMTPGKVMAIEENFDSASIISTQIPPMATFALRRAGALPPSLTNLPPSKLGIFVRFGEALLYSDDAARTPGKDVFATFEYPADWLQLDRIMGGVQFVDQRNGDKVYVLKVKLPPGVDRLDDVPKAYFGDAIFNPKGDLVRTGNNVEDYKVLSGKMITEGSEEGAEKGIPRRRLRVRYTTVTGNNFSVERKAIVDAYEVGGMVYMLMTGSNAVVYEKKGRERDTVEYIAESFRVVPV